MDKLTFPAAKTFCINPSTGETTVKYISEGKTLREHAALTLRVPDSGDERIDAMIRQANRRDAAVAAMQGLLAEGEIRYEAIVSDAVALADALIAKLEEGKG